MNIERIQLKCFGKIIEMATVQGMLPAYLSLLKAVDLHFRMVFSCSRPHTPHRCALLLLANRRCKKTIFALTIAFLVGVRALRCDAIDGDLPPADVHPTMIS